LRSVKASDKASKFTYLEHLGDFLVFIDIDVKELDLPLLLLNSFDQLRLDDLARTAPACACLDHNSARLVLNCIIEVLVCFHFTDVARSIRLLRRKHSDWNDLEEVHPLLENDPLEQDWIAFKGEEASSA
jgi:hypothetical protein